MSYRGPAAPEGFDDAEVWHCEYTQSEWRIHCKACRTPSQSPYHAKRHQTSAKHQQNVSRMRATQMPSSPTQLDDTPLYRNMDPAVPITSIYDLAATRLLQSFSNTDTPSEDLPLLSDFDLPQSPDSLAHSRLLNSVDWAELGMNDTELGASHELESRQALSNYMLDIFAHGPDNINSDDEDETGISCSDHSESVDDEDIPQTPMRGDDAFNPANLNYKRPRMTTGEQSPEWFPWPDRTACTLDILMHLPRSAFSVRQLELFLWLLKVNGVADATSVKTMKDLDTRLQQLYGIQTFKYKGAFGHIYYVNSLADIISQEMCNPNVRPHLSFYPEDSRQFDRWLNEIPDNELGPMARIHGTDYYIFEPTMFRDGSVYMPHRWFRRMGRLYARCWKMEEIVREDGQTSWRVIKSNDRLEFDEEFFLKSFPTLLSDHQNGTYPLSTNPSMIEVTPATICKWTITNPVLGNPWRQRANGAQVLSYPIWLYCDDTSGNTSKRWNEHNSFLFTSAGLDRSESSKEYNIHFLATSNSAPPLEMLDGIADQIQDCQENGVWAWDPVTDSRVLLIVCVLALLGDNPMQSEFACHIGLRGKFFCRTCWVKGKDASADKGEEAVDGESNEEGAGHSDATSVASTGGKKKRTKFKESLQTMVSRVKAFVKPGKARTRTESIEALRSQFVEAQNPGAGTRVKSKRTETGLKDTYQTFFIDRLLNASKRRQGIEPRTALHDTLKDFPSETMRLDPHTDTPVEILHVVLLGFIKYLWRDVIENQIKKNPKKKAELAARLSCINVDGLGLDSNLPGKTLVDYYGSLTGSNFRKISQVAPFVLKDFVSKDCFETWVALSKLVPLIWQPKITDLDSYIVTLEREIEQFLLYAAKWSIRWFNKPKFHILVHLPAHIRRFGPAMLFATEVFESYNAIIRAKSIHSNRLAPLADEDFNNIQLSQQARVTQVQQYFRLGAFNNEDWACVGKSVIEVASWSKESVGKYLGIFDAQKPSPGMDIDSIESRLELNSYRFGDTRSCCCRAALVQYTIWSPCT
ncbi:hypothetical protein C8R42DRAFT_704476 [Lentinula raphanica]|nr:hypothetical protein C8R42DRAFT_704476 [Lentinula raphanica]